VNFPTGDFLTSKGLLSCFAKTLLKILRRGLAHTKAKEELPEALDLGAGACSLKGTMLHSAFEAVVGGSSNTMCDNTLSTATLSSGVAFRVALWYSSLFCFNNLN